MIARAIPLLLAMSIAAAACRGREQPPPPPSDSGDIVPVAAEPAAIDRARTTLQASGLVVPASGAELLVVATEPSRILEVPWAEGDAVPAGALLVRFDVSAAAAETARRRADADRARAMLEQARITQLRTRELFDRGIVSRRELENADQDVARSEAELADAEAGHAAAEGAMARGMARAPFAGVIAQRFHDPGDVVQGAATDPILRLVDPARLEVQVSIGAADVSRILPGTTARITSVAGMPIALRVASPPAGQSAADGSVPLRLHFEAPSTLAVDAPVDVEIDGDEHVAVFVPADAVIHDGAEPAVMVARGGTAERRAVVTGVEQADRIEIVSGLDAGELVIVRGHIGLAAGTKITVQQSNGKRQE